MIKNSRDNRSKEALLTEIEELRARLDEAEQTLEAIRTGDVDALIVAGPQGDLVFSLIGAERTYRLIVETMNEAALTLDLKGNILFCNKRFSTLVNRPMSEAIGQKVTAFVAPAQKPPLQKFLTDAKAGPVHRSLTLQAADGVAVSVQLAASPLMEGANTSICLVMSDLTELEAQADSIRVMHENQQALEESEAELQASNAQAEEAIAELKREVIERKRAEEQIKASLAEKKVMLREIHHRVKNNLQIISSLISLQADTSIDERMREEFNDVRDRVRSMALVHEKLYQTGDLVRLNFADYATSLLHSLWRSHGALAEKIQLNLAVAAIALPIEMAVPCGLILNELAGNALKHAFPGSSGGEVTVEFERAATGAVCMRVRDNGVGLPADLDWRQSRSLGLRLVQILAGQLSGAVEAGTGPGAEFSVTFSLNGSQS